MPRGPAGSEGDGLRMTSLCGQRLARSANPGGDAKIALTGSISKDRFGYLIFWVGGFADAHFDL